jgi:ribosomal protein S21
MQTAASRRAFSFLASKIHPQLPLSPRESQQLLTLLTTSFRAHLDREHPTTSPETLNRHQSKAPRLQKGRHNDSPVRARSSQTSAHQHIDSILTNPLFAAPPKRRNSDPAKVNAQSILRDPLGWFLDQVAIGAADLPKAAACLGMLRTLSESDPEASRVLRETRRPASRIAEWLRASGLDRSRQFVDAEFGSLLNPLVVQLLQEGEETLLWRWFTCSPQQRVAETGLEEAKIRTFRTQVLRMMVTAKLNEGSFDEALRIFLRACEMRSVPGYGLDKKIFQSPASSIVNSIISHPESPRSSELYEAFLRSSSNWTNWHGIQALLWLHHPTKPSALAGIAYIKDTNGLTAHANITNKKRRKLLVHLCLESARQCLADRNYADAQHALGVARDNFPDFVGPVHRETPDEYHARKEKNIERQEEKNLELLDQLLPA